MLRTTLLLIGVLSASALLVPQLHAPHLKRHSSLRHPPIVAEAAEPDAVPAADDSEEPVAAEEAVAAPPATATTPLPIKILQGAEIPEDKRGPSMPVSSTADKIKGFASIFVVLLATGFVLNYSFSAQSPLLAPKDDAGAPVNVALQKYSKPLQQAAAGP